MNSELCESFCSKGGQIHALNPLWKFWNIFTREFFRRHHEKAIIIDDSAIVGSANIGNMYAGKKLGRGDFYDMNIFANNIFLSPIRKLIGNYADFYGFQLKEGSTNEELISELNEKYPDSPFTTNNHSIIRSHQPYVTEIQDLILNKIQNAKKKIVIVQPYYYPMKKFERAVKNALKRGVEVELITSKKRDQPCYSRLRNYSMTKKLVRHGMKLREFDDRFLHMKAYVFDSEVYTMGSFNNDKWSWKINNELNILVEGKEETQVFENFLEKVRSETKLIEKKPRKLNFLPWVENKFWISFLNASYWAGDKKNSLYNKFSKHIPLIEEAIRENKKVLSSFLQSKYFVDWDYDVFEVI